MFWARANSTDLPDGESAADQPRPALGRRPWFALLRRARSLRRFALAIEDRRLARSAQTVFVASRDGSWQAAPVAVAVTPRQRRLGTKRGVSNVLLRTRSVHARGLSHGLRVIAIDASGTVIAVRALPAGGFLWEWRAMWVLEQPLSAIQPQVGAELALYARPSDRTTPAVCDTDRQSR